MTSSRAKQFGLPSATPPAALRHLRPHGRAAYGQTYSRPSRVRRGEHDGAGGLIAANYTYNKADRDGTFLGCWNSAYVLYQALGDRAVRLDARKLGWIGAPVKGSPQRSIMAFTGLRTFEDILKSGKSLKMGATRAGSTYADLPKIFNQTIGTKFEVVTGYTGTSKTLLAMQSKELDGGCWGWESARATAKPMLQAKGDKRLVPVIIHRKWKDELVRDLPLIPEVIKKRADKDGQAVYGAWGAQYEFRRAERWRMIFTGEKRFDSSSAFPLVADTIRSPARSPGTSASTFRENRGRS